QPFSRFGFQSFSPMADKTHSSRDRVLGRLGPRDSVNRADLVQRPARERRVVEESFHTLQAASLGVRRDGASRYGDGAAARLIGRKLKKLKASQENESLADSVRVCREEVARLDGIIANFLEAIRPRPPDLAETDLTELLAEVLRFQHRELADRGIAVEAETAS